MKAQKNLAFACFLKKYIIKRRLLIVLGATRAVEGFHGSDVTVIPLESLSQETVIAKNSHVHMGVCVCVFSGQWHHSCAFISRLAATETRTSAHTPHTPRARLTGDGARKKPNKKF